MSQTFEEHISLVRDVLGILREYGIKISGPKCSWFQEEVEFLGHIVGCRGLRKSDKFMKTVREYPKPSSVKQLRSFLGLVNFQRKFIPHCSSISKCLSQLTSLPDNHILDWSDEMNNAFDTLKSLIAEHIELAYPDYTSAHKLELSTDASLSGSGACLSQVQNGEVRLIAYASMSFNSAQRAYSTIEKELAAIRWAVHTFRCFLFGVPFLLYTDHRPLVYMSNMRHHNMRIMRTLNELNEYNFEIRYRAGKDNHVADALSRIYADYIPAASPEQEGLPMGIQLLREVKGGGDSLIESLFEVLHHHKGLYNPDLLLPDSMEILRQNLAMELLANPTKYDLKLSKALKGKINLLQMPGKVIDVEFLPAFCAMYRLEIWVHTGSGLPVIYSDPNNTNCNSSIDERVHIQCNSGVHYNPLFETRLYKRPLPTEFLDLRDSSPCNADIGCEVEVSCAQYNECILACGLQHQQSAGVKTLIHINGRAYCALIDTGAQVSVLSDFVYEQICSDQVDCKVHPGGVEIVGLGCHTEALGIVEVSVGLVEPENTVWATFSVMKSDSLPFCAIIGVDLIRYLNIELDFYHSHFQFSLTGTCCKYDFLPRTGLASDCAVVCFAQEDVLPLSLPKCVQSILTESQVQLAQCSNFCIRKLYNHVLHKNDITLWKQTCLKPFRKYSNRFRILNEILWFCDSEKLIPVVPHAVLVELALHTHLEMSHLGRNKITQILAGCIWHPSLSHVCSDVCISCAVCQKFKVNLQSHMPPVLRIESSGPFDLVAVDLLQLPRTPHGYIGCFVIVDHFSKWLQCIPIRNKRSDTIANLFEHRVLPTLLTLPNRILSDNGREFASEQFNGVFDKFGIQHVYSTPYMPYSNGAVERANRTVSEMLRCVADKPNCWDACFSRVIVSYNNSFHSSLNMSPADCLLMNQHSIHTAAIVSNPVKSNWREGHPSFGSFKVGNKVLLKVQRSGHDTHNKFLPRFYGPFYIDAVGESGVTYEISRTLPNNETEHIKAHHSQLPEVG